jgi:hypothetical protein
VSGIIIAILLGLLTPTLIQIISLRGDLKPISSLVKDVDGFLRSRGLEKYAETLTKQSNVARHSLPPEKAAERDTLVAIGNQRGLTEPEAVRLKQLLEEDARDEFAKGVVTLLAFAAIMVAIGAIIKSLSK